MVFSLLYPFLCLTHLSRYNDKLPPFHCDSPMRNHLSSNTYKTEKWSIYPVLPLTKDRYVNWSGFTRHHQSVWLKPCRYLILMTYLMTRRCRRSDRNQDWSNQRLENSMMTRSTLKNLLLDLHVGILNKANSHKQSWEAFHI